VKPYDASHFRHDCCKPFLHEGGEKGVLLLHGFTGSVAQLRPLGDALAELGYTAMGINLPGHATTEREMARTGWQDWLSASRDALVELRRHCAIVTVAGLSMGGLLSLLLAADGLSDACVTLSTPMAVQNPLLPISRLAAPFWSHITWMNDPQRAELNDAYDFGYSGFPTRCAADLHRLIRMTRHNLRNVVCPVLAVQSEGDRSLWPGRADFILEGVHSDQKRKLILTHAPHVCTLSTELPTIVTGIDEWMKKL
jgi:carboxylesterase